MESTTGRCAGVRPGGRHGLAPCRSSVLCAWCAGTCRRGQRGADRWAALLVSKARHAWEARGAPLTHARQAWDGPRIHVLPGLGDGLGASVELQREVGARLVAAG